MRPVRIAPSALAPGVPHAALYQTRGHSLLIDGMLFPAASLINGTTITWHEAREFDELEFFHVMFDSHDALYIEGALCESLLTDIATAESISERSGLIQISADPHALLRSARLQWRAQRTEITLAQRPLSLVQLPAKADIIRD